MTPNQKILPCFLISTTPRLKRSLEYFVGHYAAAELNASGSYPLKLLERGELLRMSRAKRVLAVAITDFVDGTQDFFP